MTMPTVAVTTAANAAAMMKATASSTRLPLRMKFLKPVMTPPRPRTGSPVVLTVAHASATRRSRGTT